MKTTIVYAHPWEKSLTHGVLEKAIETLKHRKDEVTVIDLYKDHFDPVMSEEDLRLYGQGKSADPLVAHYSSILDTTEKILFIFPVWWYDMPAIMRGFLDKVLLSGSAYTEDQKGMHPVRNISHTVLLTTSSAPTDALIHTFGDPINGTMIKGTFASVGFFHATWHNFGGINGASEKEISQHLASIPDFI